MTTRLKVALFGFLTSAYLFGVAPDSICTPVLTVADRPHVEHSVKKYGDFTLAYSTLQPGMQYFEHPSGYLAYNRSLGVTHVLADPVCEPAGLESLLVSFLSEHPNAVFWHITEPTAEVLSRKGFNINRLGTDLRIDLHTYNFDGKQKSNIRQAAGKLTREGYEILEVKDADLKPGDEEGITGAWRESRVKSEAELRFLTRPIVHGAEPDVRKFYVRAPGGKFVGLYYFDPVYKDGKIVGYSYSFKRRTPDAPTGTEEAVFKYAVEKFQEEGFDVVYLGLIPLYKVSENSFKSHKLTDIVLEWAYQNKWMNRFIFNFKGQADFKHRYRGEEFPIYFASNAYSNVIRFLGMLRLSNLFGSSGVPTSPSSSTTTPE